MRIKKNRKRQNKWSKRGIKKIHWKTQCIATGVVHITWRKCEQSTYYADNNNNKDAMINYLPD